MSQEINHYDLLGVSRQATAEEIKRAYHRKAMDHHPDRGGSHRRMGRLNEAWAVLGDATKRREYDTELALQAAAASQPVRPNPSRGGRPRHGGTNERETPLIRFFARVFGKLAFWIGRLLGGRIGGTRRSTARTVPSTRARRGR